ncbi:MAG: MOSC domain-containing protein [Cyclobacteriaceae bacterium]
MKVVSVNIGERQKVSWRGKTVETGIFKKPVDSIHLDKEDVQHDNVIDRKYHGGFDKACYLFSADAYPFWKSAYPNLDWHWGMFGENITVEGLDESKVYIGSKYKLGDAIVEVSEPRQPCFKLGICFGTQQVLKDFIAGGKSGVYLRVLQPGKVIPGDQFKLTEKVSEISIRDVFDLTFRQHPNPALVHEAVKVGQLAESARKDLRKLLATDNT